MTMKNFQRKMEFLLRLDPGSDERAPGGAVTVALCGHWNHEGACRWPHFSRINSAGEGVHRLLIEFDSPKDEVKEVEERVERGLRTGRLIGPDGRESRWHVVDTPKRGTLQ